MRSFIALFLAAASLSVFSQTTVYFDDGSYYELADNERIYVNKGQLFQFTRFEPGRFHLEAAEELCISNEVELGFGHTEPQTTCSTDSFESDDAEDSEETDVVVEQQDCLTFGGGSCGP